MQITLKRALKLRKELEALVSKTDLPTAVQVSLLIEDNIAHPTVALKPGTEALIKKVEEYDRLSQLLSRIRIEISKANVAEGIDAALAASAHATRMMALYKKLSTAGVTPDVEQLKAELVFSQQALQNPDRNAYDRPQRSTSVSVVFPELREKAAENAITWKRALESLEDTRAGKNASVKIEIAEGDAELLRQHGLI